MIYYLFLLFVHLVIIITLPKVKLRLKLPQFLKRQLLYTDSSYYCGCSEGRAIQRETIGSSCSSFTNHVIPLLSLLHSAIILLTASPVYNWVCFNLILLLFFSFSLKNQQKKKKKTLAYGLKYMIRLRKHKNEKEKIKRKEENKQHWSLWEWKKWWIPLKKTSK